MTKESYVRLVLVPVDYDPFAGGALALCVPTTEPQKEIWLADQLGPEASLAFNLSVSLRLRGVLDVDCLHQALQELVDRHDALRASLSPDGHSFCIRERFDIPLPIRDFSGMAKSTRTSAVDERLRNSVETRFVLATGPLFRAELLKLAQDEHLLLLAAHHVVCDGWSWSVVVEELGLSYAQRRGFSGDKLPDPVAFSKYALAEAEHQGSETQVVDEAYWLSCFSTEAPVLELPTDRPRPPQRSFASARVDHVLDAALVSDLRRMGARHRASLFSTVLAGFSGLLTRLAGQSEVVVAIPAAGQPLDGHDQLVGHCINLLPLRLSVDPSQPFFHAIESAQARMVDALEHQRYTLGTLLRQLHVRRDSARMPLVSVMFNFDQAMEQDLAAFPGLSIEYHTNPRSFETFEIFVNAVQAQGELRLECQYNRELFDASSVRRWLRGLEAMLRAAVAQESVPLGNLPLVDAAERAKLASLQPTPLVIDGRCRMHEHFEAQCDRTPDRIALRCGDSVCTYGDLEERANRIAHRLRADGVQRGSLVGLALERGIDMVAALLGVLKAGAGYVPLDPRYPQDRLAYMTADAGLAALLTSSGHAPQFNLAGGKLRLLDQMAGELAAAPGSRIGRDAGAAASEGIAYVIYTSGSTGHPKAVRVPHRAVANFLASMQREPGLRADDRLLAVTTLSFDIAVLELMLPLSVGAEVVIAGDDGAGDGMSLAEILTASRATVMQATPSTWRMLVDSGWRGAPGFKALCGGETLPPDLADRLLRRCGSLWNLYGPTETTVWSTCARIVPTGEGQGPDVSIGRPIANTQVWILDPRGELCPRGVPGEIYIGGEGVTLGYLDRPALTAERFVPDRFASSDSADGSVQRAPLLYRTGDRGRWRADGSLEHLGRLDHQVKVRGHRIEMGEIEAHLSAREEVAGALVIVREDQPNDQRLVAYVVTRPHARFDEAGVRSQLRNVLPGYMVPQHFVQLDALPLLPNGKLDREALPQPTMRQATIVAQATTATSATQLSIDPRVRYLAQVWSDLLGMEAGAEDNFFDLGGHSMLAVQMMNRVAADTGVRIRLIRLGTESLGQIAADLPVPQGQLTMEPRLGKRLREGLLRTFGFGVPNSDADADAAGYSDALPDVRKK